MNKVYSVTYLTDLNFNPTVFHNYINSLFRLGQITDWWHYTDSTYLIVSSLAISQIYSAVFPGVPGRNLLIIEVNPNNAQGWLPKAAWDWLQKYQTK